MTPQEQADAEEGRQTDLLLLRIQIEAFLVRMKRYDEAFGEDWNLHD